MDEVIAKKIDDFFTKFKSQTYRRGEILIRADDNPQGIFYLKTGMVKEYIITSNGEEVIVNIFKPVSFFPMSWAMNNSSNEYFFEAMTELKVWRVPKEEAIKFLKENPDVTFDLLSRVYKGVDGLLKRMVYLMGGNATARLLAELLIYIDRFAKGESSVELTLSEKDLAAQTGMTRETISRQFKILKDKGLVTSSNGKLFIPNIQSLKDLLSENS